MRERWWLAAERRAVLEDHGPLGVARWMHLPCETRVLSTDRQSAALRVDGAPPLLVKWRRPLPGRRRRTFLRPSRERREAVAMLHARSRGIPCPAPWAVGERRRLGFLQGAVLVREFDDGALTVEEAAADEQEVLDVLAAALRRWHDLGFRHGDCYPKNVLVGGTEDAMRPIGCPAARFLREGAYPDPLRMRDLAQLAAGFTALVPATDPFALLDVYLREPGLPDRRRVEALVRPFHARIMAKKKKRLATRPRREPDGPPPPVPLAPDEGEVRAEVQDLGRLAPRP